MTKAFFAARKQRGLIAGFDNYQPVRVEPCLRQGGGKQISTCDAPQDLTLRARSDAGSEKDGCCAVQGASGAAGDFMQRCNGEARARKHIVHVCKAKRERRRFSALGADAAHLVAKLAQNRVVSQAGLPKYVPDLFQMARRVKSRGLLAMQPLNLLGKCRRVAVTLLKRPVLDATILLGADMSAFP